MTLKIYDYDNQAKEIEIPGGKKIQEIHVVVLSGDETGDVLFEDGSRLRFDASDCRLFDYYDGNYIVLGEDVEKWLNFEPKHATTYSYQRRDVFDSEGD